MTPDQPLSDVETLLTQLHEHAVVPLTSPAFREAARKAATALNALSAVVAQAQAEEARRAHPRITDGLGKLHRRYRRDS